MHVLNHALTQRRPALCRCFNGCAPVVNEVNCLNSLHRLTSSSCANYIRWRMEYRVIGFVRRCDAGLRFSALLTFNFDSRLTGTLAGFRRLQPTFTAHQSSRIYLALKFLIDITCEILATGSSPNSAGAVTITWTVMSRRSPDATTSLQASKSSLPCVQVNRA